MNAYYIIKIEINYLIKSFSYLILKANFNLLKILKLHFNVFFIIN